MEGIGKQGFPDFIKTLVFIDDLEKNATTYPIGVMVNEERELVLVVLSNAEASKMFPGSYEILLIPNEVFIQEFEEEPPE